jgi:hypothetical protein
MTAIRMVSVSCLMAQELQYHCNEVAHSPRSPEPAALAEQENGLLPILVVMPLNARPFVERAVASALEQDYPNVELVVVDDGSTDGSREILAELAAKREGRMSVLHQQRAVPARNEGFHMLGSLIAFSMPTTIGPRIVSPSSIAPGRIRGRSDVLRLAERRRASA